MQIELLLVIAIIRVLRFPPGACCCPTRRPP